MTDVNPSRLAPSSEKTHIKPITLYLRRNILVFATPLVLVCTLCSKKMAAQFQSDYCGSRPHCETGVLSPVMFMPLEVINLSR